MTATSGNAELEQVKTTATTGNITATAGTDLIVDTLTAAGDIGLTAGNDITANTVTADGSANMTAGQDINAIGIKAGGKAAMTAAKNLTATTVEAKTDIDLTATNGNAKLEQVTATIGKITAQAGTDINVDALEAAGNINFTAGNDILVNQIQSTAGDLNLNANRSITNTNLNGDINLVGNNLTLTAHNGSIGAADKRLVVVIPGIVEAQAAHDIHLEARSGDLKASNIVSQQGDINLLVIDGSANIDQASASRGTVIIGATAGISVHDLQAQILELNNSNVGSKLTLGTVALGQGMKAAADNISIASIEHTGDSSPMQLSMTGGSKAMADTINVTVSSNQGVAFDTFAADKANVKAYADKVSFLDTRIGSWANFRNNHYYVAAHNTERHLIPSDMQIMPENNSFQLTMAADRNFLTNALVINYLPEFMVNGAISENSLIRQTGKATTLGNTASSSNSESSSLGINPLSAGSNDGFRTTPIGNMVQTSGDPINTGSTGTIPNIEDSTNKSIAPGTGNIGNLVDTGNTGNNKTEKENQGN